VSGKQGFAEDYIPVNERIALFVAKYPEGSLRPLWPDEPYRVLGEGETKWLVYGACAYRWPDDPAPGVGMAWEPVPGRTPYTKGSELMVAETSAWGRALAAIGIATNKSIASAEEVRSARERSQAPREGRKACRLVPRHPPNRPPRTEPLRASRNRSRSDGHRQTYDPGGDWTQEWRRIHIDTSGWIRGGDIPTYLHRLRTRSLDADNFPSTLEPGRA
jgi:hypothetical protein